jgi:hypothetical protein
MLLGVNIYNRKWHYSGEAPLHTPLAGRCSYNIPRFWYWKKPTVRPATSVLCVNNLRRDELREILLLRLGPEVLRTNLSSARLCSTPSPFGLPCQWIPSSAPCAQIIRSKYMSGLLGCKFLGTKDNGMHGSDDPLVSKSLPSMFLFCFGTNGWDNSYYLDSKLWRKARDQLIV